MKRPCPHFLALLALGACTRLSVEPSGAPEPTASPTVASPRTASHAVAAASTSAPASSHAATPSALPAAPPALAGGGPRSVRGEHGVITSVEARATRAGLQMLEAGGNAVDAAVACAFALAVTHPSAGNLGGGGFALVRPRAGPTVAVDFRETAPRALDRARFDAAIAAHGHSPLAVGVPGSVAGLLHLHDRWGKLPRARLVAPALALARRHRLGQREALTLRWAWQRLRRDPALEQAYGAGDRPKRQGEEVRLPRLASVLERIARDGSAGFYRGATASTLLRELRAQGGLLDAEDLERYRVIERQPLEVSYRGLTVQVMPPPSGGGVVLAQLLLMLDALEAWRHPGDSVAWWHLFLEASRRAQAERRYALVDPDALAPAELARRLERWRTPRALFDELPIEPERATPSAALSERYGAPLPEEEHTTHLSVVDADGMVVSLTTTLSAGFGAGLSAGGVILNNSAASFSTSGDNLPVGGRRTVSSMAPTLLLQGERVRLVLGSPGGDTIPSTIAAVLHRLVDEGRPLDDAVDAPRLHQGYLPDEFRFEQRRPPPPELLRGLEQLGHRASRRRTPLGDANNLLLEGATAHGYADPREGGLALAAP